MEGQIAMLEGAERRASMCDTLLISRRPGCPATVPKGALRRIGTIVARRVEKHVYMLFD